MQSEQVRPTLAVVEQDAAPAVTITHTTTLIDRGAFAVAECTCGWHSFARRSRPLARREGIDHELLHAPPSS